LQAWKVCKSP